MGGGGGVVGLAENIATQPSLAGAWAELGNLKLFDMYNRFMKLGQSVVPYALNRQKGLHIPLSKFSINHLLQNV